MLICWAAKRGVCGMCADFQHETSLQFHPVECKLDTKLEQWKCHHLHVVPCSFLWSSALWWQTYLSRAKYFFACSLPMLAINWLRLANFIPALHFSLGARARRRMAKWLLAPPRWATHFPVVKRTVLADRKPLIFCCICFFFVVAISLEQAWGKENRCKLNCQRHALRNCHDADAMLADECASYQLLANFIPAWHFLLVLELVKGWQSGPVPSWCWSMTTHRIQQHDTEQHDPLLQNATADICSDSRVPESLTHFK